MGIKSKIKYNCKDNSYNPHRDIIYIKEPISVISALHEGMHALWFTYYDNIHKLIPLTIKAILKKPHTATELFAVAISLSIFKDIWPEFYEKLTWKNHLRVKKG